MKTTNYSRLITISSLAALLAAQSVFARPEFISLIPNGGTFSCFTCHNPNQAPSADTLNQFGRAFNSANRHWTPALAALDSDGDGFSNGTELGDPTGSGTPTPGATVTNPGDPASHPPTPPPSPLTIALTSVPASGSTVSAPAFITLTATVSSSVTVTQVEFFQGSTSLGALSAPPFSFTENNLSAGSYSFTATAMDSSGATATSTAVTLTVTAPPPPPPGEAVVTVTATQPNASEAGPTNGVFTVARTGDTGNPLTVHFLLSGTAINGEDYTLISNAVTIASGAASAMVTIMPMADNDSPPELKDTVILQLTPAPTGQPGYTIGSPSNAVVTIAETSTPPTTGDKPPTVQLVLPRNGARFNAGAMIVLLAQAADVDGSVTKVEFFAGNMSLGMGRPLPTQIGQDDDGESPMAVSTNRFFLIWRNVPSGNYAITAVATDNAGLSTTSSANNITVLPRGRRRPPTHNDD